MNPQNFETEITYTRCGPFVIPAIKSLFSKNRSSEPNFSLPNRRRRALSLRAQMKRGRFELNSCIDFITYTFYRSRFYNSNPHTPAGNQCHSSNRLSSHRPKGFFSVRPTTHHLPLPLSLSLCVCSIRRYSTLIKGHTDWTHVGITVGISSRTITQSQPPKTACVKAK